MNSELRAIFFACLAVACVHSSPKLEIQRPVTELSRHLMALMEQQQRSLLAITDDQNSPLAILKQYLSMLNDLEEPGGDLIAGTQSNEVGPNFNEAHFLTTMNGVALKAWRTRCKKIGGHENQYAIAMYAREEFMPCIENWERSENFYDSQNFKSSLKKACIKRSGFFACTDKYVSEVSGCYYPGELEIIRKMDKIFKNMVDLMCTNAEFDFELFGVNGEGQRCFESSQVEIMTCTNKALYSVTQRILEKWIENEHFQFEVEAADCEVYDGVRSCFVSSFGNCVNPTVKNMVSSAFEIIRNETKCANITPFETNKLN